MRTRAAVMLALAAGMLPGATWVETSAGDFLDGAFSDGIYGSNRGGGAVEFVARLDLNNDGFIDIICPDDTVGLVRVYFGAPTGFDTLACRRFPSAGGGGAEVADLNCDGHAELIHSGWHARFVTVYWGSDSGPSGSDTTRLDVLDKSEAVTVADLDRNGWLDIIAGVRSSLIQVFWGSAAGYLTANRTDVTVTGKVGHNLDVADLDNDGWLDIVAATWDQRANPVVYWGPDRTPREVKYLPVTELNPHGVAIADLNRDGWLDLTFPGYDTVSPAYIYYGSDSGFNINRRDEITPGLCYGGVTAVDWDRDDDLDLVFFLGEFPRGQEQPVLVYRQDPGRTPRFRDDDTLQLCAPGFNSSGGLIADFNRDGVPDLFVDVYTDTLPSLVFWGPDYTGADSLPAVRSHHGQAREVGNVYDRSFREGYVSSVFGDTWPSLWHRVTWDDSVPPGTTVELAVRTGWTSAPDSTWSGWLARANGDSIPDSLDSRYIQYRVGFTYPEPTRLPCLTEVRFDFDPFPNHDVGPVLLIAPAGAVDSGLVVTPRALVRNFGNRDETFPVTLTIGGGYSATVTETLAAGAEDTASFPDWQAGPVDTFPVTCFTALANDTNRANDTLRGQVVVLRPPYPDVGVTAIVVPAGSVDSGASLVPKAVVRNFGPLAATFPVTMTVGTGYRATVTDTLAVGESDTVVFAGWIAQPPGRHDVVCFTSLIGDGDRRNDTLADTVRVRQQPVPDVGAVEILVPGLFADSGMTYAPRAVVRNFSIYDAIFPVTFDISSGYASTRVETLAAGRTDTMVFAPWVASPMGTLGLRCYTQHPGDPNPANDTVNATTLVGPPSIHDLSTDAILAPPGSAVAGESLMPRARVKNLGRRAERYFDVRFRIVGAYDRVVNVSASLAPDSAMVVAFPVWVAEPGQYLMSCSTMLVGDMAPENDKRELALNVARDVALAIEPDRADTLQPDDELDYRLTARFTGDTAATIDLDPVGQPSGWVIELRDTTGQPLAGTLGRVRAGVTRPFLLHVRVPGPDLAGVRESLGAFAVVVRGTVREYPAVSDSAVVRLRLSAGLEVHNYPNPMHDDTRFIIGLPDDGRVTLVIYNRAGEVVRTLLENRPAGAGVSLVRWDGTNDRGRAVASGTYRYVFSYEHGGAMERLVKKLVVVRE